MLGGIGWVLVPVLEHYSLVLEEEVDWHICLAVVLGVPDAVSRTRRSSSGLQIPIVDLDREPFVDEESRPSVLDSQVQAGRHSGRMRMDQELVATHIVAEAADRLEVAFVGRLAAIAAAATAALSDLYRRIAVSAKA